jgi:putative kinase
MNNPANPDGFVFLINISDEQLTQVFHPFAAHMLALQQDYKRRIVVGIAGAPGSGKSTFAEMAVHTINQTAGKECARAVGMDGWHYSNQVLEQKFVCHKGKMVPLKAFKGSLESFNDAAFVAFLAQLMTKDELSFPVYDRTQHDPQPDAGMVLVQHNLILVEGNYLLLNEERWGSIRPLLDRTCFIQTGESLRWQSLLQRHIQGGKTPQQALKQIYRVDVPNALRTGQPQADIVIERSRQKGFRIVCGLG